MSAAPSTSSDAAAAAGTPTIAERDETDSSGDNGSSHVAAERQRRPCTSRTLDDVMREPSRTAPDVVVLDSLPEPTRRKDTLDPREDLWLSTADGRYTSPIIPLHVGEPPHRETFYVHKHVLLKSEYFQKALCGEFRESGTQSIDLPEENPAIFHFLVAYLYEGKYEPIRPAASVLVPDEEKGKDNAADTGADSDSESHSSLESDVSVRSRWRHERSRRRNRRDRERMRQKHPGMHRPSCACPQCVIASNPPCWSCRAPRNPPSYHPNYQPRQHHTPIYTYDGRPVRTHRRPPRRHHHLPQHPLSPPLFPRSPSPGATALDDNGAASSSSERPNNGGRIVGEEDRRTWLLAYELHLDAYLLADRFLLGGLKRAVARAAVDMLEAAGSDAGGVVEVLFLCRKLLDGLSSPQDPFLKMVFARVGFLQPWRRDRERQAAADDFLAANPDVAALLLREMAARREEDVSGRYLPSMVRSWQAFSGSGDWQQQFDEFGTRPGPPPGFHARRMLG
ncbi:hypothetical protein C7999DRAFT_16971 [Corynascus novoguineensis]|uniref:BTB domain-containing protein n=1 Tax=Corynascus novoguineensis TaxID=1126955 RepID=A0AAN7CQ03_9PEZI|nr:hypothetical protein C7999DRAFT_16971 [Corynascus novoguineensis]